MNWIQFINIIILNAIAWFLFSYFWSYWTFKLFKPYHWLNHAKKKLTPKNILSLERKEKDKIRFYTFWLQLERIKRQNIPGSMAEVGVYKGETANIMHQLLPDRSLFLFDSFSGFPKKFIREDCDGAIQEETVIFTDTSAEIALKAINGNHECIHLREGIFPETATGLEDETFAFVHLDADLYQSTLDGLIFFYSKLSPGGVILIHDYNHKWPGVTKAVDEFAQSIVETPVEIADMAGSVLIIKNKIK